MALRDSKLFRVVAYTMFGLSLASFAFAVVVRVANGHGAEVYRGGRGLLIPNVAALVTIGMVVLVLAIWLFQLVWRKWRRLRALRIAKSTRDAAAKRLNSDATPQSVDVGLLDDANKPQ
ncbi:MAG: hypothetical protein KA144_03505 [Xanthomonadaceae bacterium]|nr:hypothetical protein [Xanthomonadaceae bacterium]